MGEYYMKILLMLYKTDYLIDTNYIIVTDHTQIPCAIKSVQGHGP